MRSSSTSALLATLLLPSLALTQLTGTVGPATTTASKAAVKICNILDYDGSASVTFDNGPAILAAWEDCKTGGEVYIPAGRYGMATWVTLSDGDGVSINLDGTIYRTGSLGSGGHMFWIENTTDFEFYSSTSKGAIQGYGYEFHKDGIYGPRLIRLVSVVDFSVHDIALVDSPAFHLLVVTCTNGEVYNMIIRGGNEGGLDGIDVSGSNIHVHDVEVSNKDECVTIKQVICSSRTSTVTGVEEVQSDHISNIEYNNVYSQNCNQMMMIKSNGGDGTVKAIQFNNFIGHSNAYSFKLDAAWSSETLVAGDGVVYSDISIDGWTGTCASGTARGPIQVLCPAAAPCYDISITNFDMWTESGSSLLNKCANAYGSGECLKSGSDYTSYSTTTQTITATPTSYSAATMAADVTAGFGLTVSIDIPAIPTTFFPGATPASALLG